MYSSKLLDHFERPRYVGHLENASAIGLVGTPGNGPFMALFLLADDRHIKEVAYKTYGCAPAIAAGSVLCDWLIGRSFEECQAFTEADLVDLLGGLPDHKLFCATLAVRALQAAFTKLVPKDGSCASSG